MERTTMNNKIFTFSIDVESREEDVKPKIYNAINAKLYPMVGSYLFTRVIN
jgi:hypothetical protein